MRRGPFNSPSPITTGGPVPQLTIQTDSSQSLPEDLNTEKDLSALGYSLQPSSPLYLDPQSPIAKTLQSSKAAPKDNEFRKVLGLLLNNLRNRKRPPPVYDDFRSPTERRDSSKVGVALNVIKAAVKMGGKHPSNDGQTSLMEDMESDEESKDDGTYSTDMTVDYLAQLRDVLIISERLGWNILSGSAMEAEEEPPSPRTTFKRRRQGLVRSESKEKRRTKESSTLEECIDILAEIILDDCRFSVRTIRLTKPPNALQSVCLDFAQCLITNQRHHPGNLMGIGTALLPAFTSFKKELHPRLLRFFEESVLRGMLEALSLARGSRRISRGTSVTAFDPPAPSAAFPSRRTSDMNVPVVNIEEPQEPITMKGPQWQPWSQPNTLTRNVPSTSAPGQELRIYQLSSIIGPLISAILENVDWSSARLDTSYRVHRLFRLIADMKPDSYLDLLEIVAYHTEKVRYGALCILASFWPSAVGHSFVGKALPVVSYAKEIAARTTRRSQSYRDPTSYSHHFLMWMFPPLPSTSKPVHSSSSTGNPQSACYACSQVIEGFGLMCTLCMCVVHMQCYDDPEGQYFIPYPLSDDSSKQRVAVPKFSRIPPSRRLLHPEPIDRQEHLFHPVNLFTLTPCLACRLPLWGCGSQAMECQECQQFVHLQCSSSSSLLRCGTHTLSSTLYTVDWKVLRSTFLEHYRDILFSKDRIVGKTYEEISISYDVLCTQLEILRHGINSSTILMNGKPPTTHKGGATRNEDYWEIHHVIEAYRSHLHSNRLPKSETLEEYRQMSIKPITSPTIADLPDSIIFEWPLLVYITALIKSPQRRSVSQQNGGDYLTVNLNDETSGPTGEDLGHPFEIVSIAHMRDVLAMELKVLNDPAAKHLLSHLHHAGFLHPDDYRLKLFAAGLESETMCIFPLPLVIDYSTSVETLVSAIDVCLRDLDIAVNEVGFLWLMKRCWPDGMASDYALHRLVSIVISWIVSEDDRLVRIARDYVTRAVPLPGVRPPIDTPPWPTSTSSRLSGIQASAKSGNDYLACRKDLSRMYCCRWLLALHDQDAELYAKAIYDACVELAREIGDDGAVSALDMTVDPSAESEMHIAFVDRTLKNMQKIHQTGVMFSAFESTFTAWLDAAAEISSYQTVTSISSLRRLYERPTTAVLRASLLEPVDPSRSEDSLEAQCWRIVIDVAAQGSKGVLRAARWLRVLAHSSIEVPQATLIQLAIYALSPGIPFSVHIIVAESIFCSAWVQMSDRHDLIPMISQLQLQTVGWAIANCQEPEHRQAILDFTHFTFAACLLLYGCDRKLVNSLGFVDERFVAALVIAKPRAPQNPSQLLGVDNDFVQLATRYINEGDASLASIGSLFLCTLFTQPSLLAPDAVSRFLSSSGGLPVYESISPLYELKDRVLLGIRTRLVIQLLATCPPNFGDILARTFRSQTDWTERFRSIHRLFSMMLEFNDPKVLVESSKFAVLPIFAYFFRAIWEDRSEEVRLSARTLARTLLPSHFLMITSCWEETLPQADLEARLEIVLFLIQLSPHFPTWEVLSWHTIVEIMRAGETEHQQANGPQEAIGAELRLALVTLSLQMLGNGISADLYTLLSIKQQVAVVFGFSGAEIVQASDGASHIRFGRSQALPVESYACLSSLVRALDAGTLSSLPPMAMGVAGSSDPTPQSYIGAIFIDVALAVVGLADFRNLPYLASRAILDAVIVIIYKYDMMHRALVHLQEPLTTAVDSITHIVKLDISYDVRNAAFATAQAFLKRWPNLVINILRHQIFTVSDVLTDLGFASDDLLVAQGTAFLETAFDQFAANGLFFLLFKYPLQAEFFKVVRHVLHHHAKTSTKDATTPSLKETVLSDTITKMTERPDVNFTNVLTSVKMYVDIIHHQSYSLRLMQDATLATHALTRITMDPNAMPYDPNPWLETCLIIIRHNKGSSKDLVAGMDLFLKASLVRFELTRDALKEFLILTAPVTRRDDQPKDTSLHTATVLLETLSDALRGKLQPTARSISSMLTSIKETLKTHEGCLPSSTTQRIGPDAAFYLSSPPTTTETYNEANFTATLDAADVIHEALKRDGSFLQQHFILANERIFKTHPPVRAWNALALTALLESGPLLAGNLLHALSSFASSFATSLRPLSVISIHAPPEAYSLELNQGFMAVKLWLLLCRKTHDAVAFADVSQPGEGLTALGRREDSISDEGEESRAERRVWNELWPPFEGVLAASMTGTGAEDSTPLNLAIWTTFAEVVIFIHQIRSPVAMETYVNHLSTLKELSARSRSDTANNKFSRAVKAMQQPPNDAPLEALVAQARAELLAAEKLNYALERRRTGADRADRRQERRKDNRTGA